jgi:hypothetical protein
MPEPEVSKRPRDELTDRLIKEALEDEQRRKREKKGLPPVGTGPGARGFDGRTGQDCRAQRLRTASCCATDLQGRCALLTTACWAGLHPATCLMPSQPRAVTASLVLRAVGSVCTHVPGALPPRVPPIPAPCATPQ